MSLTLRSYPLMEAEHGELKDWNHALVGLSFLGIVSQGETD